MIIAQVCLRLPTIKGHSKMCSFTVLVHQIFTISHVTTICQMIPSSMLVLLLFSSPHSFSTRFGSEDWNGYSRSLVLCSVTHFGVVFEVLFGLLYSWKIQTWRIIRFLNKMSRTSSRNICDVGAVWQFVFQVFCPRDTTIFCNSSAVVLGESLATQTLLLTVH